MKSDTRTAGSERILFEERTRRPPLFAIVVSAIIAAGAWWAFIAQVVLGHGGDADPRVLAWILVVIFGMGLPYLIFGMRLDTTVTPHSVSVRLWPFPTKTIDVGQVRGHEAVEYRPIRDYGGWGIRYTPWAGRAYNIRGKRGVRFDLANGSRILIGSMHPERFAEAVGKARSSRSAR